ncbi:hypothetical protein E2C01_060373 [Portunus trituberculatus]|uniref:Uncharacterized protein n=1 Tax=Portunus trituberculatus TaxID=210409 RepID=A0A5B7HAA6_PORTR|nr:hypothetical protein [Portunus trituberculatus]
MAVVMDQGQGQRTGARVKGETAGQVSAEIGDTRPPPEEDPGVQTYNTRQHKTKSRDSQTHSFCLHCRRSPPVSHDAYQEKFTWEYSEAPPVSLSLLWPGVRGNSLLADLQDTTCTQT